MPSRKKLTVNVISSYEEQPQVTTVTTETIETKKKRVSKKKPVDDVPTESITESVVVSEPTIVETKKKRVSKKKQIDEEKPTNTEPEPTTNHTHEHDDNEHEDNEHEDNEHEDNEHEDFVDIIVESITIDQLSFFIDQNNILYHTTSLLPIASLHNHFINYFTQH
jgi:hypothetical protein